MNAPVYIFDPHAQRIDTAQPALTIDTSQTSARRIVVPTIEWGECPQDLADAFVEEAMTLFFEGKTKKLP